MRHLGVLVVAKSAKGGMRFHDRSARGEESDDSDDGARRVEATATWKLGPVRKSLA